MCFFFGACNIVRHCTCPADARATVHNDGRAERMPRPLLTELRRQLHLLAPNLKQEVEEGVGRARNAIVRPRGELVVGQAPHLLSL